MPWITVVGFGMTHLLLPNTTQTVCDYRPGSNSPRGQISNIAENVTCVECLNFAQVMQIPTSRKGM